MESGTVRRLACLLALWPLLLACELFGGGGDGDHILSGMDFVGRGYDVFSNYADPLEVKAEVLDFQAMLDDGLIERIQLDVSDFQTIEGVDVNEYMNKLSVDVGVSGGYAGFSGSVEVNFDESHYTNSEYSFATVQTLIKKYSARIGLGTTADDLKDYLTDGAQAAINEDTLSPEEVFVSFGTHVLRGIIIGGRLDYNVSADMSQVGSSQRIGVLAEAGYDGAFSVNVFAESVTEEEMLSFSSKQKKSLKVYGGSSEYGQYIIAEDEQGYTPWIESLKDNPVFCDFDQTTPIVPIWELCDDPTRAAALESGYADYAAKRAISIIAPLPGQCIVDIGLYDTGHAAYSGPNPTADGWYLVPQDLNHAVPKGNYIYILFKYGMDTDTNPAPITGLHTVDTYYGEGELPGYIKPAGWVDLNKNGGGHYIYLYFSRGGSQAIRGIATKSTWQSVTTYYYSVPGSIQQTPAADCTYQWDTQDLNDGCDTGAEILLGWTYDRVD